jgi:starch-binding outer membrane protein SusE/F
MKKTLLFFLALLSFSLGSAQSISIVGEAVGGWPDNDPDTPDTHIMSTVDNITYTLSNLTVATAAPGGGAKFRQDGAWTTNWGNAAFPSGTGTQGGANILTVAGTYDVTFNRVSGAYSFTNVVTYPGIGMIGTAVTANGFDGPDVDMVTFDGITYTITNYTFLAGEMKFRMDDSWDNSWGSAAFPSGTATLNGSINIPVPAGTYSVTFNRITGDYSFTFPGIGIIGTAVSAGGFSDPDTDLMTSDGVHYVLYNHTFTDGVAKFRQGDDWDVNWGNADGDFPSGLGLQGEADIPVTAGTYTVSFNRETGAYSFDAPVVFANIGVIGTAVTAGGFDDPDTDMATADGITYTLSNYVFTDGVLKFRQDDLWDNNWGGIAFPSGTAIFNGQDIAIVAGTYTLTFNIQTLAYSFVGTPLYPSVGILGTAVTANGFDGPDVNLSTTDGETYTLENYTFVAGEAKFRQDDAWGINWGSNAFPSGTATLNGSNIPVIAGTFDVTFTRSTGAYSFSTVGAFPAVGILGTAVDANGFDGPDTDLMTTDGIIYVLEDFTFTAGEAKFRQDDAWDINWGNAAFPSGTATVNGSNIMVTAGTYDVTFNRLTGAYSFININAFANIGIIGDAVTAEGFDGADVDMQTTDGITYTLMAYTFTAGEAKFRQDDAWDVNWGSADFPSGVGTQGGSNIAVAAGTYNVTFNMLSGAYSFDFVNIGILGTALTETNGFDGPDVDMGTLDGINYFGGGHFTNGEVKFRQNDSWNMNWGGLDFPGGIYTLNGGNIPVTEGDYSVTFNRLTGEGFFNEVILSTNNSEEAKFSVYPNPSSGNWNFSGNNNLTAIQIMDATGKTIITKNLSSNEVTIDVSSLSAGLYFAKLTSDKGSQTIKVIKN